MISDAKLHFFYRTSKKNHIFPTELLPFFTFFLPNLFLQMTYTAKTKSVRNVRNLLTHIAAALGANLKDS